MSDWTDSRAYRLQISWTFRQKKMPLGELTDFVLNDGVHFSFL